MKAKTVLFYICFIGLIGGGYQLVEKYHQQLLQLEHYVIALESKITEHQVQSVSTSPLAKSMDSSVKVATSSQLWSAVQKELQDTVVQLMVVISEKNILQPYKVPNQGQASGSGFIISDQGEILTNAHVVNQATTIQVQIPSFGKHQFEVDLIGIMPEKDSALLKFRDADWESIKKTVGRAPFVRLGDSDKIVRSQEILALGYPLGQQSLKSTTGVISGHESGLIQMSAPINPGSSGGPSINSLGEVIGINNSGIVGAQNVGYVIPINDVKTFLKDLRAGGLVRKPYIGVYQSISSMDLVKALGNPEPGGTYVVDVLHDSPLKGKLQVGDMIYSVNGIKVDLYGEMSVPWSEDKVSTAEYISRLSVGQKVSLLVYRKGEKKEFTCTFDRKKLAPIRTMYPGYESLDYEVFGGFVMMPLMVNHLPHLVKVAPNLARYAEDKNQGDPLVVVTHIMPESPAFKSRLQIVGSIVKKLNGKEVKTLSDVRSALADSGDMITVETNDNILVAVAKEKVLSQEANLSRLYGYKITSGMQQLLDKNVSNKIMEF